MIVIPANKLRKLALIRFPAMSINVSSIDIKLLAVNEAIGLNRAKIKNVIKNTGKIMATPTKLPANIP